MAGSILVAPLLSMSYPHTSLLIVGGGPVGLFLALKVGGLGIDVIVTEAEPTIIP